MALDLSVLQNIEGSLYKNYWDVSGMSWESTAEYYRIIKETVWEKVGGIHSAKVMMVSVDFSEVEALQRLAKWHDRHCSSHKKWWC